MSDVRAWRGQHSLLLFWMLISTTLLLAVVVASTAFAQSAQSGYWSEAGEGGPEPSRAGHAAVQLDDGRVLIMGGDPSESPVASVEIYDPEKREWIDEEPMNHGRSNFDRGVVKLSDGRVLVAVTGGNPELPAEIYDPSASREERWTEVAPAPMDVRLAATLLDGPECRNPSPPAWCSQVLVTGRNFTTPTAAIFDPEAEPGQQWTLVNPPTEQAESLVRLDGHQCEDAEAPEWCGTVLAPDVGQVYDPDGGDGALKGEWKDTGEMVHSRKGYAVASLGNGDVLAVGNFENDAGRQMAESYRPAEDPGNAEWVETAELIEGRSRPAAAWVPDKDGDGPGTVLVAGGSNEDNPAEECGLASAELFDPTLDDGDPDTAGGAFVSAGVMAGKGDLKGRPSSHTATGLGDGRVFVVGGSSLGCGMDSAEVYSSQSPGEPPDVEQVTPNTQITDGGMPVTIEGSGFTGASEVMFGEVQADSSTLEVVNGQRLRVVAPAHEAGTVPVRVTADGGTSPVDDPDAAFSYVDAAGVWAQVEGLLGHQPDPRGVRAIEFVGGGLLAVYRDEDGAPRAARYDPASGGLQPTADPPVTPSVVAALEDGGVVVAGSGGSAVYDPATEEWRATQTPPLVEVANARESAATRLGDGRVLVVSRDAGSGVSSQVYDPDTDRWALTERPSHNPLAATLTGLADGRALLAGGGDGYFSYHDRASVFDPDSDEWSEASRMAKRRGSHAATLMADGRVMISGGRSNTRPGAETFAPDGDGGSWRAAAPPAHSRAFHSQTRLADGSLLMAGGMGSAQHPTMAGETLSTTEIFRPELGEWREAARAPEPRKRHAAVRLTADCGVQCGHVVTFGGEEEQSAERFVPRPQVVGMGPTSGSPGDNVTISGYGFAGADEVTFGGVSAEFGVAKSVASPDSPAQITATVPSGASAGSVAVAVTNQVSTGDGVTELVSPEAPAAQFTVVDASGDDGGGPGGSGHEEGLDPVGQVDDLSAEAVSTTEIKLGWSAVADGADGVAGEYVVAQSLEPITSVEEFDSAFALCNGTCSFDPPPQTTGDAVELTVGDLRPGTSYHYAVAPVDGDGNRGPISDSVSATTAGDAPSEAADNDPAEDGPTEGGPAGEQPGDDSSGAESVAGSAVRISGPDRIATALAASEEAFEAGQAGAAVLARADVFADGLAGVPLAAAENGPLLLTHSTRLDERVAGELDRAVPDGGRVFLLGGQAALTDQVAQQVRELGLEPVRLAGPDRFATAAAIAEQGLGIPDRVLVATGDNFADAVTAGAAAARADAAVLLSAGDQLPQLTAAYLDQHQPAQRYAVGGPAADAVDRAEALVGATRYETAAAVADAFFPEPTTAGLATGLRFPDALSGGAHIARYGGPMLLSGPDRLHRAASDYLAGHASSLATSVIYGGTAALDQPIAEAASAAISEGS